MQKHLPIAALAAVLALAACGSKPSNTDEANAAAANAAAPVAKVELPPSVKSSKQYRCKDDSVVTVNLFDGDLTANIREEAKPILMLKAEEPGKPFVAEGTELVVKGDTISLTRPDHPKQDCAS
jgi:curli biogenesis system outer membrane secretion channel CsgG